MTNEITNQIVQLFNSTVMPTIIFFTILGILLALAFRAIKDFFML